MNFPRTYRFAAKLSTALALLYLGMAYGEESLWSDWNTRVYRYPYWSGAALLLFVLLFGKRCRALLSYVRYQARIRAYLSGLGKERQRLFEAALAVHRQQEERAMEHLEALNAKAPAAVKATARWLRALAAARWMMRERRVLPGSREDYPQIHALLFSHGARRVPMRRQILAAELEQVSSYELDRLTREYIELVDFLIVALGDPGNPFHAEAEPLLEFLTGRIYLLSPRERYGTWWQGFKPVLCRGGGALLLSVRMLQRDLYGHAVPLLDRLSGGGMLSAETETVHRIAVFFHLLTKSHLRLAGEDIPRFFRELYYHGCVEMGLLRYPTAEMMKVVECCRHGKDLREAKQRFIENVFRLWNIFGDELAPHLATLLKRLLDLRGRKCPARYSYWRQQWERRRKDFEQFEMLLMEGIAATASGEWAAASRLFERAGELDPAQSTPLVNRVYLCLVTGKEAQARRLSAGVPKYFPNDGGAFLSLGRLFAAHLEDIETAEHLFRMARELDKNGVEPLILLGEVKLMEGRYAESQAYFDDARRIDPGSLEARLGLARTYMEIKRFDLAVDNLTAVAKEGSGEIQHLAHYHLYRTYREMGDDRQAIGYLERIPPPFFKEPEELDDIALHLESEKRYAQARVFSERAMLLRARGSGRVDGTEPAAGTV